MLEILAIIFLGRKVGELAENKGHSGGLFKGLFIAAWFCGEILGAVIGGLLAGQGAAMYGMALIMALCGGLLIFVIAVALPDQTYQPRLREYDFDERPRRRRRRPRDEDDRIQRRRREEVAEPEEVLPAEEEEVIELEVLEEVPQEPRPVRASQHTAFRKAPAPPPLLASPKKAPATPGLTPPQSAGKAKSAPPPLPARPPRPRTDGGTR
jgi:hypothetical protein